MSRDSRIGRKPKQPRARVRSTFDTGTRVHGGPPVRREKKSHDWRDWVDDDELASMVEGEDDEDLGIGLAEGVPEEGALEQGTPEEENEENLEEAEESAGSADPIKAAPEPRMTEVPARSARRSGGGKRDRASNSEAARRKGKKRPNA